MIDIVKILKRSWQILWSYRVLWIFGFLLALTTGGGNSSNGSISYRSNGYNFQGTRSIDNNPEWVREITQWFQNNIDPLFQHPAQHFTTFVLVGLGLFLFFLVVGAIVSLVRYPVETAVIRMVDEYEQTGAKLGFRQGWRLGWSRRAFRIWLIDLILNIPAFLFVLLGLVAGLFIFFSVINGIYPVGVFAIIAVLSLAFVGLIPFIFLMLFLGLLRNFFVRAAALGGLSVGESFRKGWAMFKGNWKSAGLMWLAMIGIGIAFGILAFVLFFLLIPVYLILLIPAGLVAIIPGLVAFGITSVFSSGPLTWVIGILVALPLFFLVLFIPLFVISGWFKIYSSNVWTLTYREIKAMSSLSTPASA